MIKIDDNITDIVMTNFDIFRNIHPNVITIAGVICNYFILKEIDNITTSTIDGTYFASLLLVRFLADCLDGAVARKYKKTSKLGNILDTISDMMFIFIIFYFLMIRFNLANWCIIFYIMAVCLMEEKYSVFASHESVKNSEENIIDLVVNFLSNNTIVTFVIFYFVTTRFNKQTVLTPLI